MITDIQFKVLQDRVAALEKKLVSLEARKPETQRGQRRSQLPEGFELRDEDHEWIRKNYPNIDEFSETEKFIDYYGSTGDIRANWFAAWRNWIRKAAEFSPPRTSSMSKQSHRRATEIGAANRERRDRALDQLAALRNKSA